MNALLTRQRRDRWNSRSLGVIALIGFLFLWFNACSSSSPDTANTNKAATPATPSPTLTRTESVPASLSNAGEYGENIYDYAKANDWKKADAKLAALKDAVKQVRTDIKNQAAAVDRLDTTDAALDRAVAAKDRQVTMREANQVTFEVADM